MKRKLLVFAFLLFSITINVRANTINSIKMDVNVLDNGNALITEVWDTNLNKGTEGYHPYFNLGNSSIVNYSVRDLNTQYSYVSDWNINATREAKKNKNGIYVNGNETDLCWGIGEYGKNTYTLTYTINNFIYNTTDGYQILYWTLIPKGLSAEPNSVYIKVHSANNYSSDLPVWGYGNYGGYAYVYDGYIEMSSKGKLGNSEYMTLLVKYPNNTFTTNNSLNKSFDEVYEMAQEGSTAYEKGDDDSSSFWNSLSSIFFSLFPILFMVLVFAKCLNKKYISIKVMPNKNTPMFRDIPKYELMSSYFVCNEYNLLRKKEDLLGAVLLKWVRDDIISIDDKIITFNNNGITNASELSLYELMQLASVDKTHLETKDFKRYCNDNYEIMLKWFDDALVNEFENLKDNQMILFNDKKKTMASNELNEFASELYGLKTFFKEFSSLDDKRVIEVKLWRDYLIYAQLFGMAKKVAKEFKNVYPDIITEQDYNTFIYIDNFSVSSVSAISQAQSRAENYSSGGGGFSSGGGGGGSFGGGGSGGGFR